MTNKSIPKEEDDQKALAELLDRLQLLWFHPANEGLRKPQYAAKLAKLGLKSGVPDVMIFDPPPKHPNAKGAAIELKRIKGGKVSDDQHVWLTELIVRGWRAQVCRGIDEAIEQLKNWGYLK